MTAARQEPKGGVEARMSLWGQLTVGATQRAGVVERPITRGAWGDITETIIRGLETPEELAWITRLAAGSFGTRDGSEANARRWLVSTVESPEYQPGQWRGAIRDGRLVGGYILQEREMRVGAARLRAGGVGAVITAPEARGSGVGRALMLDAVEHARRRQNAFLLLDGIPNFYGRFGYVDVFDLTEHVIAKEAVEALQPSRYSVRAAGPDDAPDVLGLYERHYGCYTGSFERSLEMQRHLLRGDLGPIPMVVAIDGTGVVRGYLELRRRLPVRANEVAADDWEATRALLHHHVRVTTTDEDGAVRWPLPSASLILADLTERLSFPELREWEHITTLAAVRSVTYRYRDAGWVGRPANIAALFRSMLPAWQERWRASRRPWRGTLILSVDGERCPLLLGGDVTVGVDEGGVTAELTAGSLAQLVFGYHDAGYIAGRKENHVPPEVVAALRVLFPMGHAWIPGTDSF